MYDSEIGVFSDELGERGVFRGVIDVCLVDDDDAIPRGVGKELLDIGPGEKGTRGVTRRGYVNELDVRIGRQRGGYGGDVELKVRCRAEGNLEGGYVVDLGEDGVHAIRRRADQDGVAAGGAETADKSINRLIATDADEDVLRGERGGRVGFDVAQVAEELLESVLVRVRVAVEAEGVDANGSGASGGRGVGGEEGWSKGVFVGI